jgi:hypothetical protein
MNNPDVRLAVDDRNIYMVGEEQSGYLYRIPLSGDNPKRIAISVFDNGRLNLIPPIMTGDWIVFADTPATLQGISNVWKIRAINLIDLSERVVSESTMDPLNILTTYSFAGEAGKIYWTREIFTKDEKIDQVTISMMDLDNGKTTVLSQSKYEGWTWSLLQVSGNRLVMQKNQDDNHHNNIFLFDLSSKQFQALSDDGVSNRPLFGDSWVVWQKRSGSPDNKQLQIHNLQTLQTRTISLPGTSNSDPLMSGSFVYWSGETDLSSSTQYPDKSPALWAFYLFDLSKNIIYEYRAPQPSNLFTDIVLRGKNIAWIRKDITGTGKAYLEWTTMK